MKVFIAWSGERSKDMALALKAWLPLVLHYVEPWMSDKDIAAGEPWDAALTKELETVNFGLLSLTRDNRSSPWIAYEAGSLAKSVSVSRVIPLLLDLDFSEIAGPLARFQAKKADKDGVGDVVQSINRAAPQPEQESRVQERFNGLWASLKEKLDAIPAAKGQTTPTRDQRDQHEIFDELVGTVRSLKAGMLELAEIASTRQSLPRRRLVRSQLMMLHEMARFTKAKPGDPLLLLMLTSIFRDQVPWLYEFALEFYRAAKSSNQADAKDALDRLRRAFTLLRHGPFPREFEEDRLLLLFEIEELAQLQLLNGEEPGPREEPEPRSRGSGVRRHK